MKGLPNATTEYLSFFLGHLELIETRWFAASALLFIVGTAVSYPVASRELRFLTWYPLWIWKKVRDLLSPEDPWLKLFVFLFVFNSVSLLANLLSGFLIVGPPVFAFLLGMNLGVISVEEAGAAGIPLMILLNPVAWIELPAAFVSLAAGMQLATSIFEEGFITGVSIFPELFETYLFVVLPLLLVAALLESTLIRFLSPAPGGVDGTSGDGTEGPQDGDLSR